LAMPPGCAVPKSFLRKDNHYASALRGRCTGPKPPQPAHSSPQIFCLFLH
jgi:hypothetical protein